MKHARLGFAPEQIFNSGSADAQDELPHTANQSPPDGSFRGLRIAIHEHPQSIETSWRKFESKLAVGHASSTWCLSWYNARRNNPNARPFVIVGRNHENQIEFILPLERIKLGPARILSAPGAGHNSYFEGVFSERIHQICREDSGTAFWDFVGRCLRSVDAIAIEGFSTVKFGQTHPVAFLPRWPAAHNSMDMKFSGNWEVQYERDFNRKVRGDDRRCERRLNELGELTYHVATHRDDRLRLLETLLAQRAIQFDTMEVPNPFKAPEIVAFYRQLVERDSADDTSTLFISTLELDRAPIAVNLGQVVGTEMHALITSMSMEDVKRFSPGRLLFLKTSEHLSNNGFSLLDFGMGEQAYKQGWCDRQLDRHHVYVGYTLIGQIYILQQRLVQMIKTRLKQHPHIKAALNRLRKIRQS